ncbi:MAG: hypothetical protein ACD_8C00034G0011 [uncultured bacterium]|nr:MAG: hypothetical protein ACD_8C00034G0011 [uncultured bacterium]
MANEFLALIRKPALGVILLFFVALFFSDSVFLAGQKSFSVKPKECFSNVGIENRNDVLKISEISGPMIDGEAAWSSCEEVSGVTGNLPVKVWIFLLFAYVSLLIFNLAYGFASTKKPRWFFEGLLTFSFIFGWFYFDKLGVYVWFPLNVVKLLVVIYVCYLYFLEKKNNKKEE